LFKKINKRKTMKQNNKENGKKEEEEAYLGRPSW
jgi:hypothetical protein